MTRGELEGFAVGPLLEHVSRERRVGVLLVRLGGHASGVFEGRRLVDSKVGSRLVHGRHKKGGSSARRFERRREGQARLALEQAADTAARVLLPHAASLDALVTGGDRAGDRARCSRTRGWRRCARSRSSGCSTCPTRGSTCCARRRTCSWRTRLTVR